MIHPSSLFRTHSNAEAFSAPRNLNLGLNNFDCGLKAIPWLAPVLKLEKYAKTSVFVFLFCSLGLFQGILQTYFKTNSQHFHINHHIVDWVLISPNIFIGLLGIPVAYFGNRIHRPTWLGSLAIFQAITAWTLIIPEMYHPQCRDQKFCTKSSTCLERLMDDTSIEKSYITTTFLFTYQLFFSFSFIAYFTFGITYIDDHINIRYSIGYLCIELLCWKIGEYFGLFLSLIPIQLKRNIFFSFVWLICATIIFVIGCFICLFPKLLPSKIEENGVDSLLHITNGQKRYSTDTLWQVLKRLLKKRILVLTVVIAALTSVATTNFDLLKNDYFQSNFYIPSKSFNSYNDTNKIEYLFSFFLQPFICFWLIITGLCVIKFKPNGRTLILYLAVMYILVQLTFLVLAFFKCEERIFIKYGTFSNLCSSKCNCNKNIFSPVCLQGTTYFSPCFAGCKENNFSNCSCGNGDAKIGPCNYEKCSFLWMIAQLNEVLRSGLLYSILLIQLLICLRVGNERDKPLALALFFVVTHLVPIIPFKIILDEIKKTMCLLKNEYNDCIIYNRKFIIVLTSTGVVFTLLSVIFCLVLYFCKVNIDLYKNKNKKTRKEKTKIQNVDTISERNEESEDSAGFSSLQRRDSNENSTLLNDNSNKILHTEPRKSTNSKSDIGYSEEDINTGLRLLENNKNDGRLVETQF